MDPLRLIEKYYAGHDQAQSVLLAHSHSVARLAMRVANRVAEQSPVDSLFVQQAALLHDIGMLFTATPQLGCRGDQPYIAHGLIGAGILRNEGLPRHALACERHIGVGLSKEDIKAQGLPLPWQDMQPQTLEEKIVAYADLFFSKTAQGMRSADSVRSSLSRYGHHKVAIFDTWHAQFQV